MASDRTPLMIAAGLLATGSLLAEDLAHQGKEQDPPASRVAGAYGPNRPGNAPPATVTYSFPSALRDSPVEGDLDSWAAHVTYLESLHGGRDFEWLVGVDWRRFDFGLPSGVALPDTLQSVALAVGADWRITSNWRIRLEVLPGVYSDFTNVSARDINAPFTAELTYSLSESLSVGGQLLVDGRRDFPVLVVPGVTWKFAERWLLSFWIPRPQIEFQATEGVALFLGASLTGGTFQVSASNAGLSGSDEEEPSGQWADYREVAVGGGVRWRVTAKHNVEVGAGWLLNRRFHFTESDQEVSTEGAPYLQVSFGRAF